MAEKNSRWSASAAVQTAGCAFVEGKVNAVESCTGYSEVVVTSEVNGDC